MSNAAPPARAALSAPSPRETSRLLMPLLVLVSMLGPLTLNILLPSLPGLVRIFQTSREQVQLTLSLFLLGMAVSQLVLGPLADRLGRRPVLIGAIVLYVAASMAAAVATTIEWLIVARVLQAFGGTAGIALGRTVIRDLYHRDHAASMIGYVTTAMVVAPMIAPSLGAFLDETFGWRAMFVFCSAFGAIALALTLPVLPETRPEASRGTTAGDIARSSLRLLKDARFLGYTGTVACCSAMFFTFIGAAPYLVIEVMGVGKQLYAIWFVALAVGFMIGNFVSGRTARRVAIDRLIGIGNILGIVGSVAILVLALAGVFHPAALFLPALLFTFGNGLVIPNAVAGGISVNARMAGAASGLLGFAQMGVGALASFGAARIANQTAVPMALVMVAFAALALALGQLASRASARHDISTDLQP